MLFTISIAFGGLRVTIEQRAPQEQPPTRTIETTGVELSSSAQASGPGLARCHSNVVALRPARTA